MNGNNLFNQNFEMAREFNNDYAQIKIDGLWGFIDKKGSVRINPQFYDSMHFFNDLAIVRGENSKKRIIDKMGNTLFENTKSTTDLSGYLIDDWFCFIEKKTAYMNYCGIINSKGEEILKAEFEKIWVTKDGKLITYKYDGKKITQNLIEKQKDNTTKILFTIEGLDIELIDHNNNFFTIREGFLNKILLNICLIK